jgi:hypothetical protein
LYNKQTIGLYLPPKTSNSTSVVAIVENVIKYLPASGGVQPKQCGPSCTVALGGSIDALLNSAHDSLGLRLSLGTFTRKLNPVEYDKTAADTSYFAEVVQRVVELTKPKLSLAGDDTP